MRLFWHPQGDYLAVQVDRFTKTRKSTFTAFELFSVKERDIPMEVRPAPCFLTSLVSYLSCTIMTSNIDCRSAKHTYTQRRRLGS